MERPAIRNIRPVLQTGVEPLAFVCCSSLVRRQNLFRVLSMMAASEISSWRQVYLTADPGLVREKLRSE